MKNDVLLFFILPSIVSFENKGLLSPDKNLIPNQRINNETTQTIPKKNSFLNIEIYYSFSKIDKTLLKSVLFSSKKPTIKLSKKP